MIRIPIGIKKNLDIIFPGNAKIKILNRANKEIPLQLSPINKPGVFCILIIIYP
jgi:hypothetical protein